MKRYSIEFTYDIEEHIPIRVIASGSDLESLYADAEYSIDCPDPKKFHAIDNLSVRSWNAVVQKIEEAFKDANREE